MNILKPIRQITVTDLKSRIDKGDDLLIIDVREPKEWEVGKLDQARPIALSQLETAFMAIQSGAQTLQDSPFSDIPNDREVIVMCRGGGRSTNTIKMLQALGYDSDKLVNLEGGILAWARLIDPTMPTD